MRGFKDCQNCKYCPTCTISPLTCDLEWITLSNKELEEHDKSIRKEANAKIEALIREIHELVAEQEYQRGRTEGIEEFDKALRTNTLIPNWCYQHVRIAKKDLLKERK